MPTTTEPMTTPDNLPQELIDHYRTQGFVKVPRVIEPDQIERFHDACLDFSQANVEKSQKVFDQVVNVWQQDATMRELTLHPNIAAIAERLAGVPLRLWHDHSLIKKPHNEQATHFHQDKPYWPHLDSPNPISCWLALCDVPPERGGMTFIPGSHRHVGLKPQHLVDPESLFSLAPELRWAPRVTLPLKAGDCTFHHGCCAHMATPNTTDQYRTAHVIIYMDVDARYSGKDHRLTGRDGNNPLNLTEGDRLDGDTFPMVSDIVAGNAPS